MTRILCVGAASWDIVLGIERFPEQPTKVLANRCVQVGEGMASAAAMAIVSLGGQSGIMARIGQDDLGARWRADLEAAGVSTELVEPIAGAPTSLSTIVVDANGERLIVPYYDSALWKEPPRATSADLDEYDAFLVDARWPAGSEWVLDHALATGKPSLLDADVAPLEALKGLAAKAAMVVFSRDALSSLCPGKPAPEALRSIQSVASGPGSSSAKLLGVTLGKDGVSLLHGSHCFEVPAPEVEAVDTLAAGDVFHGAFLLALTEGQSPTEAARFANVAAALKCTRFGGAAGRPSRAEVEGYLPQAPHPRPVPGPSTL